MRLKTINYIGYIIRNLRQKKRFYVVEFLIVLVVFVVLYSALLSFFSMREKALQSVELYGKQHATFYGDCSKISEALSFVKSSSKYDESYVDLSHDEDIFSLNLRCYDNPNKIFLDLITYGKLPSNTNEIMLPKTVQNKTNDILEIGDSVFVRFENGDVLSYVITGFFSYKYNMYGTGLDVAIIIGDEKRQYNLCDVVFNNEWNIIKKCEDLANVCDADYYVVNESRIQLFFQGDEGKTSLCIYLLLLCLLLGICFTVISSAVVMREHNLSREMAVMRSLGIRKSKIYKLSIIESFLMGAPASLIGGGLTLTAFFISLHLNGILIDETYELIHRQYIALFVCSFLIVMVMILTIMLNITRKTMSESICQVLFTNKNNIKTHRTIRKRLCVKSANIYILTSLIRNRLKTILSILLFSAAILFYIFTTTFKNDSEIEHGNDLLNPVYDARIIVNKGYIKKTTTEELLLPIENNEDIEKYKLNRLFVNVLPNIDQNFKAVNENIYSNSQGIYNNICFEVYDSLELDRLSLALVEGSCDILSGGCILVDNVKPNSLTEENDNNNFARKSELSIGDKINIIDIFKINKYAVDLVSQNQYSTEKINRFISDLIQNNQSADSIGGYKSLTIKGIASSCLSHMDDHYPVIIISEDFYNDNLNSLDDLANPLKKNIVSEIDLKLKSHSLSEIKGLYLESPYFVNIEYSDSNAAIFAEVKDQFGIIYTIVFISVVVGFTIVISTIIVNWEVSKREYAILKTVGVTTKRILKLILVEKGIVFMTAYFIGVILGILLERLFVTVTFRNMDITFHLPVKELFLVFFIVLVVLLLTTIIQFATLKRMNIASIMNRTE